MEKEFQRLLSIVKGTNMLMVKTIPKYPMYCITRFKQIGYQTDIKFSDVIPFLKEITIYTIKYTQENEKTTMRE